MDKCLLISCLVLAQIRHNGKNYQVGDVVCLSANDKLFLEKAKYVRVATPDEVSEFEQKQAGADNPPNANSNSHLDEQADPPTTNPMPPADLVVAPDSVPVVEEQSTPTPKADYDKLTKSDLLSELTARGINHNPKAKNDELVALLVADDNKAIPLEIEDEE